MDKSYPTDILFKIINPIIVGFPLLILIVGMIDIFELDNCMVTVLERYDHWDLDFFKFVEVLIWPYVTALLAYSAQKLGIQDLLRSKKEKADFQKFPEFELKAIQDFGGAFGILHQMALSFHHFFQYLPKDDKERDDLLSDRRFNLLKQYNEVVEILYRNKYFIFDEELESKVDQYLKDLKKLDSLWIDYNNGKNTEDYWKKAKEFSESKLGEIIDKGLKLKVAEFRKKYS